MAIEIDMLAVAELSNNNPKVLAAEVFRQSKLDDFPGERVSEIALGCGITDIQALTTKGFEGALITDDAKSSGTILINQNSPPARRRFTIAHELGHFVNPWHKQAGGYQCAARDLLCANGIGLDGRFGIEAQANEFAAELLMPPAIFKAAFRRAGGDPTTQVLTKVAEAASVSVLAAARRLVDIRRDCAVILSHAGTIEQIYRGTDFPFITLDRGQPLPRGSITKRFNGAPGDHSDIEDEEPATWTAARTDRGLKFLEQVLVQGNGYRLTVIALDDSDCEDDEDDEVSRRAEWNPTFR